MPFPLRSKSVRRNPGTRSLRLDAPRKPSMLSRSTTCDRSARNPSGRVGHREVPHQTQILHYGTKRRPPPTAQAPRSDPRACDDRRRGRFEQPSVELEQSIASGYCRSPLNCALYHCSIFHDLLCIVTETMRDGRERHFVCLERSSWAHSSDQIRRGRGLLHHHHASRTPSPKLSTLPPLCSSVPITESVLKLLEILGLSFSLCATSPGHNNTPLRKPVQTPNPLLAPATTARKPAYEIDDHRWIVLY